MQLRTNNIEQLSANVFDVLIVGGGINGAVAAAALAGKGAKVALIDKGDFASFTSQESSNLAWGGIKYMETYEFGLVYRLCKSRNQLLQSYPSSVREIRFLTTIRKGFRYHPIFLWLGTWLYWLIGKGFTQTPRLLFPAKIKREEPAINTASSNGGMEYSDAYVFDNDARFVFNFIRAALDNNGVAANYVESLGSQWQNDNNSWRTQVRDLTDGREFSIQSRVLVNASGPFVDSLNSTNDEQTEHHHFLSKGIHLIVDRIASKQRVLAFFANDGRLFFAIPMGDKTCIGTTDTPVEQPETAVTEADRQFVLDNINECLDLAQPLTTSDIIAERWGVRPLALKGDDSERDFLRLSRKHAVEVDTAHAHISIFGGKLTDCINVGEEICSEVERLGVTIPHPNSRWFGEPDAQQKAKFLAAARDIELDGYTVAAASEPLSERLWRRYSDHAYKLITMIRQDPSQAQPLLEGTAFIRAEFSLMAEREMVVKLEDFLRRRSKIAQIRRPEDIKQAAGLLEACELLFGHNQAQAKIDEYFQAQHSTQS